MTKNVNTGERFNFYGKKKANNAFSFFALFAGVFLFLRYPTCVWVPAFSFSRHNDCGFGTTNYFLQSITLFKCQGRYLAYRSYYVTIY